MYNIQNEGDETKIGPDGQIIHRKSEGGLIGGLDEVLDSKATDRSKKERINANGEVEYTDGEEGDYTDSEDYERFKKSLKQLENKLADLHFLLQEKVDNQDMTNEEIKAKVDKGIQINLNLFYQLRIPSKVLLMILKT